MSRQRLILILALLLLLLGPGCSGGQSGSTAPRYRVVELGTLVPEKPYASSHAVGINNRGQVFGVSGYGAGNARERGFIWENGVLRDIGALPGTDRIFPSAMNEAGEIVGTARRSGTLDPHRLFIYRDGTMEELNLPAPVAETTADFKPEVMPVDITDNGSVLLSINNARTPLRDPERGALWTGAEIIDIPVDPLFTAVAANNVGEVVGIKVRKAGQFQYITTPLVWRQGSIAVLPVSPGYHGLISDINDAGQVVGSERPVMSETSEWERAVLYESGKARVLPRLPETHASFPKAINNHGWIIGESYVYTPPQGDEATSSIRAIATLWVDGQPVDIAGRTEGITDGMVGVVDINDRGEICGYIRSSGGVSRAVLLVPF